MAQANAILTAMTSLKLIFIGFVIVAIFIASIRNPIAALGFYLALVYIRPGDDRPNFSDLHLPFWFLVILIVAYVARSIKVGQWFPESPLLRLLLGFFTCVACSALLGVNAEHSIAELNTFAIAIVTFLVMVRLIKTESDLKWVLGALILCGIAFVYYAIFLGSDCLETQDGFACGRRNFVRLNNNFGQPNYLGLNMVIMFNLAYGLFRSCRIKIVAGVLLAAMGAFAWVTLLTNSRGAFIALGVTLIFHWLFAQHRLRGVFILILVVTAIYVLAPPDVADRFQTLWAIKEDQSAMSRITYWEIGFGLIADHPLTGVGLGNFEQFSPNTPHNAYVQVASEMGLPALFIWVWMMLRTLGLLLRIRRTAGENEYALSVLAQGVAAGLLAILVQGMSTGLAHREFVYIILGLASALVTLFDDGRKQTNSSTSPQLNEAPSVPTGGGNSLKSPERL